MALARLLIILAVLCGTMLPVFSRILGELGWTAWQIQGGRAVVSVIVLGFFLRRKILEAKNHPKGVIIIAIAMTLGGPCYIFAAIKASIGLVVSMIYLGPVWVVLYEWFFRKVRKPVYAIACGLGFLGTLLIASQMDWSARNEVIGILAAIVSSIGYGTFLAVSNHMGNSVNSFVVSFWAYALGTVLFAIPAIQAPWTWTSAAWVLAFAISNGVLYLTLVHAAMVRFPTSSEGSIWLYLEVATVWLVGIFAYHESMSLTAIFGTVFIVCAGLLTLKNGSEPSPDA